MPSKPTSILHAIEACYRLDLSDADWQAGLAEAMTPYVDHGLGVGVWTFSPGAWTSEALPVGASEATGATMWRVAKQFTQEELTTIFLGARVTSAAARLGLDRGFRDHAMVDAVTGPLGIADYHAISVMDASGIGVAVAGASAEVVRLSRQAEQRLERLASHLLSSLRLRTALASVEAVLSPGGEVVHAEGEARDAHAREALRHAVKAFDHAHSRAGRRDPEAAAEAWTALVSGRWSVVERFESDGRRYLVARRNEPGALASAALTPVETHALLLRAQGVAYKAIRYELGLSEGSVHGYVQSGLRKLGIANETELAMLFGAQARALLTNV